MTVPWSAHNSTRPLFLAAIICLSGGLSACSSGGATARHGAKSTAPQPDSRPAGDQENPTTTQPASQEATTEETLPEALEALAAGLTGATVTERQQAVEGLLASKDHRVLAPLTAALDDDTEIGQRLRRPIVFGIVRTFPERAESTFADLSRNGTLRQREAALYAFGFIGDPAENEILWQALANHESRLRQAAVFALRQPVRALIRRVTAYANQQAAPAPASLIQQWRTLNRRLERFVVGQPTLTSEVAQLIRRVGDPALAKSLVEDMVTQQTGSAPLRALLARASKTNASWLGRPHSPHVESIEYLFQMENLVAGKGKEFRVRARPADIEVLRLDEVNIDRGIRWVMPLDELFLCPAMTRPEWVVADDPGQKRVRYHIPPGGGLLVGMGSMNITYWEGKAPLPVVADVTFEAERAVPLREELRDKSGNIVATLSYSDYEAIGEGWVPTTISIEIPASAPRGQHLLFDLKYRVERGVWIFVEGQTAQLDGEELRVLARASVGDVKIGN